jgi:peptidyl-prolyl cis-trans isomerase C
MNNRTAIAVLALLAATPSCSSKSADPTIATVNGRAVKRAEFDAFLKLKRIPEGDKSLRARALDQYLEREALTDTIASEKTLDNTAMRAELRELEKELVISRYFDKMLADKVNDAAVRAHYESNAAKYEETKVHVAHILLRTHPGMSEEERKAKLTAARDAYARLTKGEDFAKVADALSEDRISAKKGGDLGFVRQGSLDPRFSEKIFAMKQGELSEPFETSFGFDVAKVLEAPQRVKRPFEAVQGDIRYQLRAAAKDAETKRLEAKAKVERSDAEKTAESGKAELKPQEATAKRN